MSRDHGNVEPVSLAPLDPEEALRALLKVDPDDDVSDADRRNDSEQDESGAPTE